MGSSQHAAHPPIPFSIDGAPAGPLDQVTAVALVRELRNKGMPLRKATYAVVTEAFGPDALALVGQTPPPPESYLY